MTKKSPIVLMIEAITVVGAIGLLIMGSNIFG